VVAVVTKSITFEADGVKPPPAIDLVALEIWPIAPDDLACVKSPKSVELPTVEKVIKSIAFVKVPDAGLPPR